jgi:hypothetical protein
MIAPPKMEWKVKMVIAKSKKWGGLRIIFDRVSPTVTDQKWLFWVGLGIILCQSVFYARSLWASLDLSSFDEAVYIGDAVRLSHLLIPPLDWGPLYSVWYWLLIQGAGDALTAFRLNTIFIVILMPFLLYVLLHGIARNVAWAFFMALLVLNTHLVLIWPRIYPFLMCFLLLALIIAFNCKNLQNALLTMALLTLLAAYIRPEVLLVSFLYIGVYLWSILRTLIRDAPSELTAGIKADKEIIKHYGAPCCAKPISSVTTFKLGWKPFVSTVCLCVCFLVVATPLITVPLQNENDVARYVNFRGSRLLTAFGQHFAYRYVVTAGLRINPWGDFPAILDAEFGPNCNSFSALAKQNPRLLARHVLSNIGEIPFLIVRAVWPERFSLRRYLAVIAILIVIFTYFSGRKSARDARVGHWGWNVRLVLIAPIVVVYLGECIVIYPRDTYIAPVVLSTIVAVFVSMGPRSTRHRAGYLLAAMIIAAVTLTPNVGHVTYPVNDYYMRKIAILNTDKAVSYVDGTVGLGLIAIGEGRPIHFAQWRDGRLVPFLELMERNNIGLVVGGSALSEFYHENCDRGWEQFQQDPNQFGFVKYEIDSPHGPIYVRIHSETGLFHYSGGP